MLQLRTIVGSAGRCVPQTRSCRSARRWLAIIAVGCALLSGAQSAWAFANEPPDLLGSNLVGHREMSIVDAARANRELPLQIWYPANPASWAAEPSFTFTPLILAVGITSTVAKDDVALASSSYPLIVFSHGYGASTSSRSV